MEVVKQTKRYTIFKKRSGRYGVRSAGGAWVNGDDKTKILLDEGLIEAPKPKEPEATEEVANDDASDNTSESGDDSAEAQAEATT